MNQDRQEKKQYNNAPITECTISRSKDGKYILHRTVITHSKPVQYYPKVLAKPVVTLPATSDDLLLGMCCESFGYTFEIFFAEKLSELLVRVFLDEGWTCCSYPWRGTAECNVARTLNTHYAQKIPTKCEWCRFSELGR
jgi:hypothetical protein